MGADMRQVKVLLADDHTIVVEGLQSLLKDHFELVGTVTDGQQLVDAAKKLRPEVIVTDMSMPVLSGLDALRQLKTAGVGAKVIFLTMHADAKIATEVLRAGASGFLLKQSAGDELITAIEDVLQGRMYLTPLLTKAVLNLTTPGAENRPALTPRQRDVLRLLADGKRMKEIAAVLGLSTRTVETHKYEMMQALGVGSTAELVKYAIKHELTSE
jgi:DNA-binding NarL/FixJ family response regulator